MQRDEINDRYGFKQVKPTKQDFSQQYFGNWDTNAEFIRTCGECEDFGPDGCKSSYIEAKYGNGNTPACEDFKLMLK